jgi:hypothetical protein
MKKISLFLFVLLTLTACAVPVPTATVAPPASPTSTETPIPSPTRTLIPEPTATEIGLVSQDVLTGIGYTAEELKALGFEKYKEGEYSFPGDTVTYHGIIGAKADGSKEMLAIKFDNSPNLVKLSSSEMLEYAKQAKEIFPATPCFEDFFHDKALTIPAVGIKGISTNIVLSTIEKDASGKDVLSTQSLILVTMGDSGFPALYGTVIQGEDATNPNKDIFENGKLSVYIGSITKSDKVYSLEELTEIVSKKGEPVRISAEIVLPTSSNNGGYNRFYKIFSQNQSYVSDYTSFLSSHGVTQTGENLIIILSYGSKVGYQP